MDTATALHAIHARLQESSTSSGLKRSRTGIKGLNVDLDEEPAVKKARQSVDTALAAATEASGVELNFQARAGRTKKLDHMRAALKKKGSNTQVVDQLEAEFRTYGKVRETTRRGLAKTARQVPQDGKVTTFDDLNAARQHLVAEAQARGEKLRTQTLALMRHELRSDAALLDIGLPTGTSTDTSRAADSRPASDGDVDFSNTDLFDDDGEEEWPTAFVEGEAEDAEGGSEDGGDIDVTAIAMQESWARLVYMAMEGPATLTRVIAVMVELGTCLFCTPVGPADVGAHTVGCHVIAAAMGTVKTRADAREHLQKHHQTLVQAMLRREPVEAGWFAHPLAVPLVFEPSPWVVHEPSLVPAFYDGPWGAPDELVRNYLGFETLFSAATEEDGRTETAINQIFYNMATQEDFNSVRATHSPVGISISDFQPRKNFTGAIVNDIVRTDGKFIKVPPRSKVTAGRARTKTELSDFQQIIPPQLLHQ
ncbi:unnamed protein product [Tilletia laevis]|uniref:Uncharacterized protein n=3 Tax=Tilletia TaxID=13289 RepID=A0A8X7SWW9_9BASI|nr:hypothetical protein CF336_g4792 [Tilletia laevis]KAE8195553.1 hypothetical protein CF328_g4396 [Tilletia controversa]KAE8259231.1 hypothetical protein A4X03_0g4153 [Tilletia caries]KAE8200312.1 hypothetical protein CF335_g3984 [Tilletia laevis]KAE8247245.1 hypothetical protein A4X06_0g4595 [Tilletia controversa]